MEDDSRQPAVANSIHANLPVVLNTFIGRRFELQAVAHELRQSSTRLLTLTGPGGSGKTRLALEVAAQLVPEYRDGVFLVDLSSLSDPTLVPSAIARVLGVREVAGQPILQRVSDYLRDKQLLLVLDNFEHLLSAAHLVSDWLAICPDLSVVATSRTPLGLYGEHEFPVQPLSTPDVRRSHSSAAIAQVEAVQLFVDRARATRPAFALTESNATVVAEICVRLDGLPLAIELAAARVRMLTPTALLSRLENSLSLLTGGARDRPPRQQTLRAAIDWSYELLEPDEQRLLRQLGVFNGGFSLEAAEAVCHQGADGSAEVLDQLEALGRASLVRPAEVDDEMRFEMLETVREFAAELLEQSGEADLVRTRHAEYFVTLAETAEPLLHGPQQRHWLERLGREQPNFRGALDWALRDGTSETGPRLAAALWWFWLIRGYTTEGRRWMDAVMATSETIPPLLRGRVLYCAGYLATFQADIEQGRAWSEASLLLCRDVGDLSGVGHALAGIGVGALLSGDVQTARAVLKEAAGAFRTSGDAWGLRTALTGLGEPLPTQKPCTPRAWPWRGASMMRTASGCY
jgi:predicted ATPase